MNSHPENINYGDPNSYPTNFPLEASQEQKKADQISNQVKINEQQLTEQNSNGTKKSSDSSTDEVLAFVNTKAVTILAFATAFAIGLALKDLMGAFVMNILQPSLMTFIMYMDKNDYLPITASLRERNVQIDVAKFLGSILVFKLVIGSMYLIYKYSGVFF